MKVENTGEEIKFSHFIIQKGLNFLGSDFAQILEKDPKLKKQWKKLVEKGVLKIL